MRWIFALVGLVAVLGLAPIASASPGIELQAITDFGPPSVFVGDIGPPSGVPVIVPALTTREMKQFAVNTRGRPWQQAKRAVRADYGTSYDCMGGWMAAKVADTENLDPGAVLRI